MRARQMYKVPDPDFPEVLFVKFGNEDWYVQRALSRRTTRTASAAVRTAVRTGRAPYAAAHTHNTHTVLPVRHGSVLAIPPGHSQTLSILLWPVFPCSQDGHDLHFQARCRPSPPNPIVSVSTDGCACTNVWCACTDVCARKRLHACACVRMAQRGNPVRAQCRQDQHACARMRCSTKCLPWHPLLIDATRHGCTPSVRP